MQFSDVWSKSQTSSSSTSSVYCEIKQRKAEYLQIGTAATTKQESSPQCLKLSVISNCFRLISCSHEMEIRKAETLNKKNSEDLVLTHLSPRFRSRLTGLLLFLSLLSYPLSILWISRGGGGGGGGSSALPLPPPVPSPVPLWLMEEVGRVQEEPILTDLTSSCAGKEAFAPLEAGAPLSSGREAPSGLYPACLRLSRVKMLSMLSTSLRGLHAGRDLADPAPPEQLDFESLLVLSASQSCGLLEEEQGSIVLAG